MREKRTLTTTETVKARSKGKGDRHLPTFLLDNFIRRLISPPERWISKYISAGISVADIGCGPGHFTIPMAVAVGKEGKVFAVDSDLKSIEAVRTKSREYPLQEILETHCTSAANLAHIADQSVDVAFANGVLCCMEDHAGALAEIKRILKPEGLAYISVTKVLRRKDPRSVTKEEWERILDGFWVREKGERLTSRWAAVSLKEYGSTANSASTKRWNGALDHDVRVKPSNDHYQSCCC
jgi:ubiquinone/menaquinone biosynthesis C-methylase UbiE